MASTPLVASPAARHDNRRGSAPSAHSRRLPSRAVGPRKAHVRDRRRRRYIRAPLHARDVGSGKALFLKIVFQGGERDHLEKGSCLLESAPEPVFPFFLGCGRKYAATNSEEDICEAARRARVPCRTGPARAQRLENGLAQVSIRALALRPADNVSAIFLTLPTALCHALGHTHVRLSKAFPKSIGFYLRKRARDGEVDGERVPPTRKHTPATKERSTGDRARARPREVLARIAPATTPACSARTHPDDCHRPPAPGRHEAQTPCRHQVKYTSIDAWSTGWSTLFSEASYRKQARSTATATPVRERQDIEGR